MEKAKKNGVEIVLPVDFVCSPMFGKKGLGDCFNMMETAQMVLRQCAIAPVQSGRTAARIGNRAPGAARTSLAKADPPADRWPCSCLVHAPGGVAWLRVLGHRA
eukprot:14041036-Alexandrium_andersonii.AAC.1